MTTLATPSYEIKRNERAWGVFLTRLFSTWRSQNVNFLILRNYEELPYAASNDVDILIIPGDQVQAENILLECATTLGWVLLRRIEFSPVTYWLYNLQEDCFLHIDLFVDLRWRGWEILPASEVLARRQHQELFDIPYPVDEAIIKLLTFLLYRGSIREKYKPYIKQILETQPHEFRGLLASLLGEELADSTCDSIAQNAWEDIQREASGIRCALIRRNLRQNPVDRLRVLLKDMRRISRRIVTPPGIKLALVGPDGVGKSTLLDSLIELVTVNRFFLGVHIRHWRPDLLPPLGKFFGRTPAPQSSGIWLPRLTPGRFHWLRLLYYSVDFVLWAWLKDRIPLAKFGLLLYDRCALDMVVDPLRYGLSSARGTRLLWRLIPKPDLVILLYDDPQRIHARKPELPVDEIARQNERWLQLAAEGQVDAIIRVDAGPEEIAERVKELIIEKFIERNTWPKADRSTALDWLRDVLAGKEKANGHS